MKKILLVEDEVDIREPFTIILQSHGYYVDIATNGQEALALHKQTAHDLILLDLMMPEVDGVGFLEHAFPDGIPAHTRVVLLTNLSSGALLKRGLELGAHSHEIKSNLTPAGLLALVKDEFKTLGP